MTVQTSFSVRVLVEDVWDTVHLSVTPDWSVSRLKKAAITAAGCAHDPLAEYEVKFRGALITNEHATLGELHVPDNAAFIVLSSRRRPVR